MADVELFNSIIYDSIKASTISNISEVYTNVATLVTGDNPAGKYEFGFALSFNFDSTTNEVFMHWRTDGGAWSEFRIEPSDINDAVPVFYMYPKNYGSGVHTFEFEMRKETAGNVLNLEFLDLFFRRVGV